MGVERFDVLLGSCEILSFREELISLNSCKFQKSTLAATAVTIRTSKRNFSAFLATFWEFKARASRLWRTFGSMSMKEMLLLSRLWGVLSETTKERHALDTVGIM